MQINNLQRAAQLAEEIPGIDRARKALASEKASVRVVDANGLEYTLPRSVRHNILNILNCEYERLREEVRNL